MTGQDDKNVNRRLASAGARGMRAAVRRVCLRLDLPPPKPRGRGGPDFHDIATGTIRDVLQIAFDAGFDAGLATAASASTRSRPARAGSSGAHARGPERHRQGGDRP